MQSIAEDRIVQRADSRVVARSAVWGILGRVGPMVVALLLTPVLIHQMGPSRWGVFTIALSITGMMGIFDFGIGRALTRSVALSIGAGDGAQAAPAVMTGVVALTALGIAGTVVLALSLDRWTRGALQVAPQLRTEVRLCLYILCLAVPLMLLNAALFGVLSAYQRFREVNFLNTPILVMYYVGPLVAFYFWHSLIAVILVLVGLRALMTYGYWLLCLDCMPSLASAKPTWAELRPILRMSSWMTVSNLTWPVLAYVDRFLIASFVSAAATGYYSTPADVVSRAYLVPTAVLNSAFPAVAASYSTDPDNASKILRRSMLCIATALFPAALLLVSFADQILKLWVGAAFAAHSAPVLRWFGAGILIACTDCVAANVIDAIGLPKVNAVFSLLELAVYVPLLLLAVRNYGIEGAAVLWLVRMSLDFFIRIALVARLFPAGAGAAARGALAVLAGTGLACVPCLAPALSGKILASVASCAAYLLAVWLCSMTYPERDALRQGLVGLVQRVQPS